MQPTALIADDDEDIRVSLRYVLEDAGYPVEETATGDQTLVVLRQPSSAYLVFLDQHMPHGTGIAVLQALAAEPEVAARHRFIFMTARSVHFEPEDRALLRQLGVNQLAKPYDIDVILAAASQMAASLTKESQHGFCPQT